ncbi:MAG: hypothetical protein KDC06_11650 [Chitinophagaceae bacterium]|nr:hypothetical protein [Chitinophagaceae bacterium]
MQKIFHALIEVFYWVTIFLSPFIIGAGIGLVIYIKNENLSWLSIMIASIGAIIGGMVAERIRKKYGCSRYVGRILATPDIWPDEYPEEIEARKKEQEVQAAKKKNK